jgi:transcriptional regulator with XRE-family HTH domain
MSVPEFADRLSLVLKALSISRGQFAADLGVDKSLVGRWCSGTVRPSSQNLARLTQAIAQKRPGFTLHDWDADLPALAERVGIKLAAAPGPPAPLAAPFPLGLFARPSPAEQVRGPDYEGIWRSTRPSSEMPGQFVHDHVMLRRTAEGAMSFTLGVFHVRFHGWTVTQQHQLFSVGADSETGTFVFSIFNGVVRQRADVVDGLILTCLRDPSGTPVASKCILERVRDLTGDEAADDAAFNDLARGPPFSAAAEVPEDIRRHLWHDTGPSAFAAGGDPMLMMAFARSMARGPLYEYDT